MPPKAPRPYIGSVQKLSWHIQENTGEHAERVLEELGRFLAQNGFLRAAKVPKGRQKEAGTKVGREQEAGTKAGREEEAGTKVRREQEAGTKAGREQQAGTKVGREQEAGTKAGREQEAGTKAGREEGQAKSSASNCQLQGSNAAEKKHLATLGCGSLFRLVEARSKKPVGKRQRHMALVDAGILGPTGAAHMLGLYSLGSQVPFYALPNLSATLSKALNLNRCSAVTLHMGEETDGICKRVEQALKPIGYAERKQVASAFQTPKLLTPLGKAGKRKAKKKLKKQQRRRGGLLGV